MYANEEKRSKRKCTKQYQAIASKINRVREKNSVR